MKKILLTLITIAGVSAQAQQSPGHLTCHNNMYRDSKLTHSPGHILRISDSHVRGLEPILEKISANHNLGYLIQSQVQLDIALDNKDVECQTVGSFPLSCQGQKDLATLHVEATFIGGEIGLALRVPLENLDLKGVLSTNGPTPIGGTVTTVGFGRYVVEADATVEYQGVKTTLNFNTFFYNRPGNNDTQTLSACSIYHP